MKLYLKYGVSNGNHLKLYYKQYCNILPEVINAAKNYTMIQ